MRRWRQTRDDAGHARAEQALAQSRDRLAETRRRDDWGRRLATRIRQMRAENHLAEAVEKALREGR